jgi:hypothetical protein
MAATALGATQQQKPKSFDSTTLPQQVIDFHPSNTYQKQ